jgi:hypothetical protein
VSDRTPGTPVETRPTLPDRDDAPPSQRAAGVPDPPVVMPKGKLFDADKFEERVQIRQQLFKVDREAKRRLDAEEHPSLPPPAFLTLTERLARPRAAATWRIENWLPVNARVMLTAQYKAGKTTLIGNLIRSLVDGDKWLGVATVTPIEGPVVLIDAEMSPTQLDDWYREQGICAGDRVVVLPMRGGLSSFNILDPSVRAEWAKRLRAIGAQYLILDCLRPFLDALGLDEQRDIGRFLVEFDALLAEAGILEAAVVHHMGHGSDRARGDSRARDWPDVEWRLVRENDHSSSARYLMAYGRDVDVPEGSLQYDLVWRRLTLVEGSSRKAAVVERALAAVLAALTEHAKPLSGRDLESAAGEKQHSRKDVRLALKEGVKRATILCQRASKQGQANLYSLPAGKCTEQPPVSPEQNKPEDQ